MTEQKKRGRPVRRGRPTDLTPELQADIVMYLEQGNYIETVCHLVNIHKDSFYTWMKRGHKEDIGIYRDFADSVKRAMATAEANDVRSLLIHGQQNWQALAWRLERRFPQKWGKKDHLTADVTSQHTERQEIIIEQQIKGDPEAADLLKQLYRRQMALDVLEEVKQDETSDFT